jgi:hypothetical protein
MSAAGRSKVGTIVIDGASVSVAIESKDASGIGSGFVRGGTSVVGTLVIRNGNLSVKCELKQNAFGVGVGAGKADSGQSLVHFVLIANNTVHVVGSYGKLIGARIGSGAPGQHGISAVDDLTIVDSTINIATSADTDILGSAIGTGYGDAGLSVVNVIMISGSAVMISESGFSCAAGAIGSGMADKASVTIVQALNICGGEFRVVRSVTAVINGPAIGAGSGFNGNSSVGDLLIAGASVHAEMVVLDKNSGSQAAVIGAGSVSRGISAVNNLTIVDAHINVSMLCGHCWGAAIGTGQCSGDGTPIGCSAVNSLAIVRVDVVVARLGVGSGAAIGTSFSDDGHSIVDSLIVIDTNVTATNQDGPAIGTGYPGSNCSKVFLGGMTKLSLQLGRESAITASQNIVVMDGTALVAQTNTIKLFNSEPSLAGLVDLSIAYATDATEQQEPIYILAAVEVGLIAVPGAVNGEMVISSFDGNWNKSFVVNSSNTKRLFISVASPGNYSLSATSREGFGHYITRGASRILCFGLSSTFTGCLDYITDAVTTASVLSTTTPLASPPSPTGSRSVNQSPTETPAATVSRSPARTQPLTAQSTSPPASPLAPASASPTESANAIVAPLSYVPLLTMERAIVIATSVGVLLVGIALVILFLFCRWLRRRRLEDRATTYDNLLSCDGDRYAPQPLNPEDLP